MNKLTLNVLVALLLELVMVNPLYAHGDHSIPCSGPHKHDPGCDIPLVVPSAIAVNSATVDWLNEKIIVRGANFSVDTTITIAGQTATISSQTADQIEIPFDAVIAGIPKGNHNLVANDVPSASSGSMSLFIKAEIIDQALGGCPCEAAWIGELGALWGTGLTSCFEASGGAGNPEDIAGTILTDATDSSIYPHYPIGAAFTADPVESVCRLTRVSSPLDPASITDLVKTRVNRQQQQACRTTLASNVCGTVTPLP